MEKKKYSYMHKYKRFQISLAGMFRQLPLTAPQFLNNRPLPPLDCSTEHWQ